MFGGGAKKKQPTKPRHAGASLSSFGLIDVPGTDEFGNISLEQDDDDDELQAELNAIAYGSSKAKKPVKKKQIISENELQNMVEMCMQGTVNAIIVLFRGLKLIALVDTCLSIISC